MRLIVAISGASAVQYGIEFLQAIRNKNIESYLVMSEWAENIITTETDFKIEDVKNLANFCFENN